MSADQPESISITVCGDGGTGKSSISLRLVRSKWTEEYDPTVQDSYSVTRIVDGRTYHLNLTDTAGQEEYRGLFAQSSLDSDAYLLVYDITSSSSLAALDYFNDLVEMQSELQPPGKPQHVKIVAGNKCDLADKREVKSEDGLKWARGNGCGFMETSAREVVNVEETFELLVRRVVAAREAARTGRPLDENGMVVRDGEKSGGNTIVGSKGEYEQDGEEEFAKREGAEKSRGCACAIM